MFYAVICGDQEVGNFEKKDLTYKNYSEITLVFLKMSRKYVDYSGV